MNAGVDLATASITIERMTEADVADVARMAVRAHLVDKDTSEHLRTELSRPWTHLWVARPQSGEPRVVGYIESWFVADEVHILNLAVDPAYQRRSIGRNLVERAQALAREHGAARILLEVRTSNTVAIRLYRGMGFGVARVRAAYYKSGEDAYEMISHRDPSSGRFVPHEDEFRP